jgi:hypothetical protein
VQTNEDNLSEEVQTDEINYKNKWTQKPVSFRTRNGVKSSVDEITIFSQVTFMVQIWFIRIVVLNLNTEMSTVHLF